MNRTDVQQQILTLLKAHKPDTDFTGSDDFIGDYLLDSFDLIALTDSLSAHFAIDIALDDIDPANFRSLQTLSDMVARYV